jgi:putative ABC transport system permease protein
MSGLLQDLVYGVRQLRKAPGFAAAALITLALGIGANTAIFSVVNAVLLNPLPFKDPARLLMVWNKAPAAAGGDRTPLAVSDLLDLRQSAHSFAEVGVFHNSIFNYVDGGLPERVQAAQVSANFFSMLGVQAQQGRTFLQEEDRNGGPRVALLSSNFVRKHFAADQQVVGSVLKLDGVTYTIIGVAPPRLDFPDKDVELWTPLQLQPPTRRGPYFLTGMVRLKPDVNVRQARAELETLKSSLSGEPFSLNLLPTNEFIVGEVRLALQVLLGAVTLVLLIAVVNVANLMLVRSATRARETSIRAALGASPARIMRQFLIESLLLAFVGGLLGASLAAGGVRLLLKLAPDSLPRLGASGFDGRVLVWTTLVSLISGVLFGLAPAWGNSRANFNWTLKEGGRAATAGASRRRGHDLLVISELGLAVLLLIGAGLLIKSFWRLQRVDSGVATERVLTMRLALRGPRYEDSQRVDALYPRLLERVRTLPGVRTAAVSNSLPPDSTEESDDFTIEGRPVAPKQPAEIAYMVRVSPDYFRTYGIPLRRGRYLSDADTSSARLVTVISETMARHLFPHEDPLGKRINFNDQGSPVWWEVVGIVGDVKYTGLADKIQPAVYQSIAQATSWNVFLSLKTEVGDPLGLVAAVRNELRSLDPELPVSQVGTVEQRFARAVAQPRFRTTLIVLFAALALLLALVGIYGVISYSVTQCTQEIGIRLALGAPAGSVLKLVLRQGAVLAIAGVVTGLGASFALTRLLKNLLFNVITTDWPTFAGLAALLITVALLACYIPARRAAKVDPMVALRYE